MRFANKGFEAFGDCAIETISFISLPMLIRRGCMQYRCEATSIEGFVQQVAVSYVANGYFFYVAGCIPINKDPRKVDAKIISQYDVAISKWARARKKQNGSANLQYIRFSRFFLIMATHGRHRFFDEEREGVRDVRRYPVKFAGYSISFRAGHASVRIDRTEYQLLKAYFLRLAVRSSQAVIERELNELPFEPYAPVCSQLRCILRAVNGVRKQAGLSTLCSSCLRTNRRVYRPFGSGQVPWNEEPMLSQRPKIPRKSGDNTLTPNP